MKVSIETIKKIESRYFICSCGARLNKLILGEVLKPYCSVCGKSVN